MKNMKALNRQFELLSKGGIFDYCLSMNDPVTQAPISGFVKVILNTFREETQTRHITNNDVPIKTRSGRMIKRPDKLNL